MSNQLSPRDNDLLEIIHKQNRLIFLLVIVIATLLMLHLFDFPGLRNLFLEEKKSIVEQQVIPSSAANFINPREGEFQTLWKAPDTAEFKSAANSAMLRYGRSLIVNTAKYLGPNGSIAHVTNGMNCQNCHLDAGTRPFGNNYGAVASTYPKYRARSGHIESLNKRINDCVERSLNGQALDTTSQEMNAIRQYIEWVGHPVAKGEKPKGSGIYELPYLDRAASAENGAKIFEEKCVSCHQKNGQGLAAVDGIGYTYPPLWGTHSYNIGAGLYRISRFAGFIKYNMPVGSTFVNPQLTDEEAWDLAAFVDSQDRPKRDLSNDWPKIVEKPTDHPFGPFADAFSENQHKFGPFQPIATEKKSHENKK